MQKLPDPPPEPQPGGGPVGCYEYEFNLAYYASLDPRLAPFSWGFAGQPGDMITQQEREDLADRLYAEHVPFDEQIQMFGTTNAPYATMYARAIRDHLERVPVGTGTAPIEGVVDIDDLKIPWDESQTGTYLLVSIDIEDFPPFAG
jgi:hypothetical protein